MADTKRILADLLKLFEDNHERLISEQDIRDAIVTMFDTLGYGTESQVDAETIKTAIDNLGILQTEVGNVKGDVSALQTEVETIQSDLSILQAITDALKAIILDGASYGKLLVGWGDGNVPHWINIWEEPLNIWTEQRFFWNEPKKPVITTKLFDVEPLGLIANEIANSFETAEDSEQKSGVSGLVDMDTFETENCLFNADALGSAFDYTVT